MIPIFPVAFLIWEMGFFLLITLAWKLAGPLWEATFLLNQVCYQKLRARSFSGAQQGPAKAGKQPGRTMHHSRSQLFVANIGNCN